MPTLFDELSRVTTYEYSQEEVREFETLHDEIRALKAERNAVIVAHNYYRPEILKVADFVGDSLELALMASNVRAADVIDFCGVHFMAETAKILNPSKRVLLPNLMAGCQLADSAPVEDLTARIAELKERYPDLAVVSYVNTTAAVKALSDIIVTSANAAKVVRTLPNRNILFVPDRNLASHVAQQVPDKNIIPWEGFCYVHQQITPQEVQRIREADPELEILVHPECRPDVAKLADAVLSTSGMVKWGPVRSPGDGSSGQDLREGMQALHVYEGHDAGRRARLAPPHALRHRSSGGCPRARGACAATDVRRHGLNQLCALSVSVVIDVFERHSPQRRRGQREEPYSTSIGKPASTQASRPPASGRTFENP
jgi:quinolinate synthase